MRNLYQSPLSIAVLTAAMALTACGGDSNNNSSSVDPGPGDKTPDNGGISTATRVTIDASAGGSGAAETDPDNKFSYFSFTTGAEVALLDSEAQASSDWDIGFKRNKIIVNDKSAKAAVVAKQADFYNADGSPIKERFLAATADSEAAEFIAVTADNIEEAEFKADAATPALGKAWYNYDVQTHVISANTENHWLIQHAEKTDVSIFNVKDITTAGRQAAAYTVQFFENEADKDADFIFSQVGTEFIADFSSKSEVCYDVELNSEVDCLSNMNTWDLRFDSSFEIWLNGGIHGTGDASTTSSDTFEKISAMTEVVSFGMSKDTMSGTFTDADTIWWEYGINGGHSIWSNYRVYAVETSDAHYKLRVLSYYAPQDSIDPAAGTSGVITVEYEKL